MKIIGLVLILMLGSNAAHADNPVVITAALIASSNNDLGLAQQQLIEVFESYEETCIGLDGYEEYLQAKDEGICEYFELLTENN